MQVANLLLNFSGQKEKKKIEIVAHGICGFIA